MNEEERRQDDDRGRGGRTEGCRSEDGLQHTIWNTAATSCLKWKVFVRGNDSTLHGRGICEVDEESGGEGRSSTPGLDGEATRSFYESVVRQTDRRKDTETHGGIEVGRQKETDTDKQADININRHRKRDTEGHRHTHTHYHRDTDRQRDRHRNTASRRPRQADTNTDSDTMTQDTALSREQGTSSECEDCNTQHTCLPSTPTLPLGPQDTNTALRLAQTNDTAALSTMLDQGLNVNTKDGYGWSLLMVAACAGALDTVLMLLNRGARTGFRDARGNTALYLATIKGHREVTEILVKANKRRTRRMDDDRERDRESSSSEMSGDEECFCDICEVMVKERERVEHTASIIHQFKMKAGPTRTQYGIPPTNRGYQLLVGQGWDTEGGLGSEKQGLKFPVKTVLKRDRKGFGAGGDETPRVTHFGPGDAAAVKRTRSQGGRRMERPATISRKEMKRKKIQEQEEEIRLRRMLNEPDY